MSKIIWQPGYVKLEIGLIVLYLVYWDLHNRE